MAKRRIKPRRVARFIYAKCKCGKHLIDLDDLIWNDPNTGFYTCYDCKRPLICRGDDGNFYYVGEQIKI